MTKNDKLKAIQKILGVKEDGIWGPISQGALIKAGAMTKKKIQKFLGASEDGVWSKSNQNVLNKLTDSGKKSCLASSFADPQDVKRFLACKATGKTDIQCFAKGDNGIGQFGAITAQTHTPMVALHATDMKARWGSVNAAAHRMVLVTVGGMSVAASVEDRMSAPGRIDLNPACARFLNLKPPFLVPAEWSWIESV